MIARLNDLKSKTNVQDVKTLCESVINAVSSGIYNGVTPRAQLEIERVTLENLFEELSKYPNDEIITQWVDSEKRIFAIKHLGVRKAIDTLLENEGKNNSTLYAFLKEFEEELENTPEVLLYEKFISALSGFSYFPAVNTELDAIARRVKTYKNDIDISKIVEVMKETKSSYLIPYIEVYINNYLNNKTEQNKHFLKEALVKFSYDAFIRDIINIVSLDATQLQLEYSNAECDICDKLYSPIIYLGENETLFNVKGSYYIKKGNNINKVKKEDYSKFDPTFVILCETLNQPNIVINKKDIEVYLDKDKAVVNENGVSINEQFMSNEDFKQSYETSQWFGNSQLYYITEMLRDNFDEIVEIDFVKRVYLKENEDFAADVFKLRDNIFITTFDPINDKTTFYRNVNPIQAERIMMEHMRFDVSKTFTDILPNKEKILSQINETKQEYTDYIQDLENKIEKFSYVTDDTAKAVVEVLIEELEEVKNDYKAYLNEIEKYVRPIDEDLTVTIQDDQTNQTHTVTVPTNTLSTAKGEDGLQGTNVGTEVGTENVDPASEITFQDDEAELLSDEPTMANDKVDMGASDVEADADEKEAEDEINPPEEDEAGGLGAPDELGTPEEGATLDNEEGATDTADDEDELENKDKKEEKLNDAAETPEVKPDEESPNLERSTFDKDKQKDEESNKPKKKVFLKRTITK